MGEIWGRYRGDVTSARMEASVMGDIGRHREIYREI